MEADGLPSRSKMAVFGHTKLAGMPPATKLAGMPPATKLAGMPPAPYLFTYWR
jgi:hypothetical protein